MREKDEWMAVLLIRFAEEEPSSEPDLEILTDTLQEKEFEIMLYNDDVNTFFHVIETLVACVNTIHYKRNNVLYWFIIQGSVL